MPIVTGKLTDFGLDAMRENMPRVIFTYTNPAGRPQPGIAKSAVLASHPVIANPAYNGYFEAELVDSSTISPAGYYTVSLEWRDDATRVYRREDLPGKLYVPAAGGILADLLRIPSNPALVWQGAEQPGNPSPGSWWLQPNGDLAEYSGKGWTVKTNLRGPAGYNATGAAADDAAIAAFIEAAAGATKTKTALDAEYTTYTAAADLAAGTPGRLAALAAAYVDKPAGEVLQAGVIVPEFELFRSVTPGAVTAGALRVNPAYTNALPALDGTPGIVGAGGKLPGAWPNAVAAVSKEIISVSSRQLVVQFGTAADRYFGGFRTDEIYLPGEQILTFDAEITGVDDSPLISLSVSLVDSSNTRLVETRVLFAGEPRRRLVLRLPAQTGPRRLQFLINGWTDDLSAGRRPRLLLANMSMHPAAITGSKPSLQPEYELGSVPARDVVLNVPRGDYVILAQTPQGTISAAATASAAGLDLRAALGGSAVISRLAVIRSSLYRPGLGDYDFPKKPTAVYGTEAAFAGPLSRAIDAPQLTAGGSAARSHAHTYAIQVTRPGSAIFTLEPGDRASQDGPTQERAEVREEIELPYNRSVWFSDQFRVIEYDYTGAEQYTLMHQAMADPNPGDPAASPEYSLTARPQPDGTIRIAVLCRSGVNTVSASWQAFIRRNEWHHVITEVQFARTGNGLLRIWLDGNKVFDQAVPVGYNRTAGPKFRFGTYANSDTVRRVIEHANVEYGITPLTDRITNPLPI